MSEAETTDHDLVQQILEAAHREYNKGILENSPAQVMAFYVKWTSPDFEERDNPKGHVTNRGEMLALMEQVVASGGFGGFGAILEATSKVSELVIKGDSAVAVVVNRDRYLQTNTQGWYGVKGEDHEIETVGDWQETWIKIGGDWRLQINQMIGNQTYVDGVLFEPKSH